MTNRQGDRLLRGYFSTRWLLVAIGILTPIGILVVNASAFVMRNLVQFRIAIAACALVSSLVLNGLTASWLLRLAGRKSLSIYLQHRDWATIVATIVVIASAIGAAIFTYIGMSNPAHLPDGLAVITSLLALVVPLGITWLSQSFLQLVLLPIIIVGQNIISASQDARAEADHITLSTLHAMNVRQLQMLEQQEQILRQQHTILEMLQTKAA